MSFIMLVIPYLPSYSHKTPGISVDQRETNVACCRSEPWEILEHTSDCQLVKINDLY
jgi:hypothetical protein